MNHLHCVSGAVSLSTRCFGLLALRVCALLALLLSSGCNRAYQKAINYAEAALLRGDLTLAARAFREACSADPSQKHACEKAQLYTQQAVEAAVAAAGPACKAASLDRCLLLLKEALSLVPGHPGAIALWEQTSSLHMERCASRRKGDSLNSEVSELACLQARGEAFPMPDYQARLNERRLVLAERLSQLATAAEEQSTLGAAAVLWSSAQCLGPDDERAWRHQRASEEFLSSSRIPVTIYLGGSIPAPFSAGLTNLCRQLSSHLPVWTRCVEPGEVPAQPEVIHVQVDANIQDVQRNVTLHTRSVNYVSGTRTEDNPEYPRARARLAQAQQALEEAEARRNAQLAGKCAALQRVGQAGCANCPTATECTEARKAEEVYTSRAQERAEAEKHLRGTPEQLEKDIRSVFPYEVKTYSWWSDFRFTVQTNREGSAPLSHEGRLKHEDEEHVGFSAASLEPDGLSPPREGAWAEVFLEQLVPQMAAVVRRDGAWRAAQLRKQCLKPPAQWNAPWVQCWAEASFWESAREPSASTLLKLMVSSAGAAEPVRCY